MTYNQCPSLERLLCLDEGDPEDAVVRQHVAHCAACQTALRRTRELVATADAGFSDLRTSEDAARRERFVARLRGEAPSVPSPAPARPRATGWRRARYGWWLVPAAAAAAVVVFFAPRPSVAAQTVDRAALAEARAAPAAGTPGTRQHVRVLPFDPNDPVAGCEPWQAMLPVPRGAAPAVAGQLLEQFFANGTPLQRSSLALGASYRTWYRRAARTASDAQVFDGPRVRVVSTASAVGLLGQAELTVRRDNDRVVRVTLVGGGCTVVLTPIVDAATSGHNRGLNQS